MFARSCAPDCHSRPGNNGKTKKKTIFFSTQIHLPRSVLEYFGKMSDGWQTANGGGKSKKKKKGASCAPCRLPLQLGHATQSEQSIVRCFSMQRKLYISANRSSKSTSTSHHSTLRGIACCVCVPRRHVAVSETGRINLGT